MEVSGEVDESAMLQLSCSEEDLDVVQEIVRNGNIVTDKLIVEFLGCDRGVTAFKMYLLDEENAEWNLNAALMAIVKLPEDLEAKQPLIKLMLSHGADINHSPPAMNMSRWTPLHAAAFAGHARTALLLIERGAELNACNEDTPPPLFVACNKGHLEVLRVLLDAGAEIHSRTMLVATGGGLHSQAKRIAMMKLLLTHGGVVNSAVYGNTPLHEACDAIPCYPQLIDLLVKMGADVNAGNSFDVTPLHLLCNMYYLPVPRVQDAAGEDNHVAGAANVDVDVAEEEANENEEEDDDEEDYHDIPKAVKVLLANGADTDICDEEGMTPLLVAARVNNGELIELLMAEQDALPKYE